MVRVKSKTPKSLQLKMKQDGAITNNGNGESSFRILYYSDASGGSVPFMWESHPGTPKQPTTESTVPPLTPPPAFHQSNQNHNSSNHSTSLQKLFLITSSRKTSESDCSSSRQSTSLHSLFYASSSGRTPSYASLMNSSQTDPKSSRKREMEVKFGIEEDGGGSSTGSRCFGGACFMKVYGMKKEKSALKSIGSHDKNIHNN